MHNPDTEEKSKIRDENFSRIKNKIIVMSGKGGVGKSTVTVNLAYALASEGNKVGIVDVDFHGPSIAKMTGIEGMVMEYHKSGRAKPIEAEINIHVLSIASLLPDTDDAVIWRGPMKIGVIRQFFEDFEWPELDYLIVDCPPGTGDEPLSVIQTIGNMTGGIIVSTPQDVAFLDARKTITFAQKLNVPILGIIENMSGFICPKCGEKIDLFKTGGAAKAAKDFDLEILGQIPIECAIVESGDSGKPFVKHTELSEGGKIFMNIGRKIKSMLSDKKEDTAAISPKDEKVAVPIVNGMVSMHFGHADIFAVYDIKNGIVTKQENLTPPPHEPGSIPKWLNEIGATKIIAGGIGQGAIGYFNEFGIEVLSGSPVMKSDDLIAGYLKNEITFAGGVCSHGHDDNHASCH